MKRAAPFGAVAEIMHRDGLLNEQPFGSSGEQAIPRHELTPPPAPPPFVIPKPDWEAEERERVEREAEGERR